MATSESQLKANKKYQQKFDRLQIRVTPEEKKMFCDHAESVGESINSFMRRAAIEALERDRDAK